MNLYLRSIGFSNMENSDIKDLKESIIASSDRRRSISINQDRVYVEYYKNYGDGIGICLSGILDEKEDLQQHSLIPYPSSDIQTTVNEYNVLQDVNKTIVICEHGSKNAEVNFTLQNRIDLTGNEEKFIQTGLDRTIKKTVSLTALSICGTILLPLSKSKNQDRREDPYYNRLMVKSREGDEKAKKMLTAFETKSLRNMYRRLKDEDILSVVDNYLLPIDDDSSSSYDILAKIIAIDSVFNLETGEEVLKLTLGVLSMEFQLFINKYDILGMPIVGMRFMGNCKFHGVVTV